MEKLFMYAQNNVSWNNKVISYLILFSRNKDESEQTKSFIHISAEAQ